MPTDIDLWANGNDPFTFPLGDYIVHVHAGTPPYQSAIAADIVTLTSPFVTQDAVHVTAYRPRTPLPAPISTCSFSGVADVQDWLAKVEQEAGDEAIHFRVDAVSGPSRPEFQTLLEGIQGLSGHGVQVDIVAWAASDHG